MSNEAQTELLNTCKGMKIKQAEAALERMKKYHAQETLKQRCILCGLTIGE